MSSIAIRIEKLGKLYRIGARERYRTLRDAMTDVACAAFRSLASSLNGRRSAVCTEASNDYIWALKDVSFEIKRGEVVGIIGRNGAGKTTLLKILSRITEPNEGYAEVYGRVGSLLEVGTGFHPELTGRENIYLNGAILGMKKAEINRKFDEIVSFAEVEKFVDTPVKHYSSGMYVRLAFAVAAHLQPEILLVDEVLAVGDIEFQKKCIGRMEKVAGEGKTVVVVSHSMSTVKALCSKAILLERGLLRAVGPVDAVVGEYLRGDKVDLADKILSDEDHLTGVKKIRVKRVRLLNGVMNSFSVYWQQSISISLNVEVLERIDNVAFGAGIRTIDGTPVFTVQHDDDGVQPLKALDPGQYTITFTFQNDLRPGLYKLHIGADHRHIRMKNIFALDPVILEVLGYDQKGLTASPSNTGVVNGRSSWKFTENLNGVHPGK